MTRLFWVALAGALFLGVSELDARPGGGHGYSGGGSGGGGSSDGGGMGLLVEVLIRLIFYYPQVGVPLAIVAVVVWWKISQSNKALSDWDSGDSIASTPAIRLAPIRDWDPEFSEVLFMDFAYALYANVHKSARDPEALNALSPYVSEQARNQLLSYTPTAGTKDVIIGAAKKTGLTLPSQENPSFFVQLMFEANWVGQDGTTHYVKERWTLARAKDATSRAPKHTRTFDCPNCAAPFTSADGTRCDYCGEIVANGRFEWHLREATLISSEPRPPALIDHAPERGTLLETVFAPDANQEAQALAAADPGFTVQALGDRLHLIFNEVNRGWNHHDPSAFRPFVSDGMFEYLRYWITSYQRAGLRNIVDGAHMQRWVLARVERDRRYTAITCRVWGTGRDYTVDANNQLVGGNENNPRDYSEYWTLIRAAGVTGAPRKDKSCPSCGAALQITMGGVCEYCEKHVTAGEFDWVLSRIEQDEAYRG